LPRPSWFSRTMARALIRTGLLFFCLQVAAAIGYQSDNLLIAHLLGATQVGSYAVPSRLFNVLPFLISIMVGPLWPAYTEAITRGDAMWIRTTFRRTVLWGGGGTLLLTVFLILTGNTLIKFWIGPGHATPFLLLLLFGIRCVLSSYLQPLSFLLNGIGKLKEQAVLALLMAVVNIVLSYIFVERYGVLGAILGTILAEAVVVVIPETIIAIKALRGLEQRDPNTIVRRIDHAV
jgi:O-antigen/teichoic acid export membrane protein